MKICIDAGHGFGQNQSPAVAEYFEGNRMFALQGFLKEALQDYGIEAVCTRKSVHDNPSLYTRALCGKGCDLLVSLHSDAVGNEANENVDRVGVFRSINGQMRALAENLAEVVASVMGTKQTSRVQTRANSAGDADYYGILRHSVALGTPALLIEHSFHTNTRSANWLLRDENLCTLAEAEAACIAESFGKEAAEMRYELLKDVTDPFYRPTLEKLAERGILQGYGGQGEELRLRLGEDAVRVLVLLDRAGVFDLPKS